MYKNKRYIKRCATRLKNLKKKENKMKPLHNRCDLLIGIAKQDLSFVFPHYVAIFKKFAILVVIGLMFVSHYSQAAITSDDFNTNILNTGIWTIIDPRGDGDIETVGTGTADAQLRLSVPAGTRHDVWKSGNDSVRVIQTAADQDFEIEVKFDSIPTKKYQLQGLLVEQDDANFLRFDVYSNGDGLYVFAARFATGASPKTLLNKSIANTSDNIYLRLSRVGDEWKAQYSYNGEEWLTAKSFNHFLAVTAMGVFVGNAGANPAYTAAIDYVFNTAAPIVPEDDGNPPGEEEDPIDQEKDPGDDASSETNIDVWYGAAQTFGSAGIPQRFINILGNVTDSDGITSLKYSLNGGSKSKLSVGRNSNRLARKGDFNAEIKYADLQPGINVVTLYAVDKLGNQSEETVTFNYVENYVTPATYQINWANVSKISDVAQVVDGKWALEEQGVRTIEPGYDRLIAIGDLMWTNYEATAEVTLNQAPSRENGAPLLGFAMRWTGHYNWKNKQPQVGWWPLGALGSIRWYSRGSAYQLMNSGGSVKKTHYKAPELEVGITYIFKMRGEAVSGGALKYSIKIWQKGLPEPSGWGISYTSQPDDVAAPPGGSLLLIAHHLDATFGKVLVVPTN
jgi:regulation of enolase protein 1 (concanavalin A-like superfamily)